MKNILFLFVALFVFACKKTETVTEPAKIISANFWKLDRFADTNSKTLSQNQLNSQAEGIFGFEFEFLTTNIVRARDKVTKQIINGGEWRLVDNSTVYIDVRNALTGNLKIIELSRNKMILQVENNKLISAGQFVNLEFVPAL